MDLLTNFSFFLSGPGNTADLCVKKVSLRNSMFWGQVRHLSSVVACFQPLPQTKNQNGVRLTRLSPIHFIIGIVNFVNMEVLELIYGAISRFW